MTTIYKFKGIKGVTVSRCRCTGVWLLQRLFPCLVPAMFPLPSVPVRASV